MRHMIQGAVFALAACGLALPAHAGKGGGDVPPTIAKTGRHDNRIYAGINWNFGARNGATAVVGYRAAKVKASGKVDGYKAELTWVLSGAPMGFGEARVKYLNGRRSVQGEIGVGFSGAHEAFLINGGVQGPFANAGVDYLFNKGYLASIGVNSLKKVKAPQETLSCPNGFILNGNTCTEDD
ncbi:MAG: hypothetical protein ABI699_17925 [Caldimonas sp.]